MNQKDDESGALFQSSGDNETGIMPAINSADVANSDDTGVFQVMAGGELAEVSAPTPVVSVTQWDGTSSTLDLALAHNHHLLGVADDVSSDEIEALAVSLWDEAGWGNPGTLNLLPGAVLTGPWEVSRTLRIALRLPSGTTTAFLIECPQIRGKPLPSYLVGIDPLQDAFASGVPEGLELEILEGMRKISRRLAGVLRTAKKGVIIAPDPDSAVNLTVYTPRWAESPDLLQFLSRVVPGIREAVIPDAWASISRERTSAEHKKLRAAAAANIDPEVRSWLHQEATNFDSKALSNPTTGSGYALKVPVSNISEIEIRVNVAEVVPQVLRWEPWSQEQVSSYEICWIPRDVKRARAPRVPRIIRLDRMEVSRQIEKIAAVLAKAMDGTIVDEDGFLVALG